MEVGQAIACLDVLWNEAGIAERLVNACLIQEALVADPVELSAAELQEAMDAFRRAQGLLDVEETYRWMAARGLTLEQLERLVGDEAAVAGLRARVAAGGVDAHFAAHRAEWDTIRFARVEFADGASARRTLAEIDRGAIDFYRAAERQAAHDPAPAALFATLRRGEAPRGWDALCAAEPGAVVGPLPCGERSALARVLAVIPARLDDRTREAIERHLFAAWLAERRRAARIEWFWGHVQRTARVAENGPTSQVPAAE
jgi:putative peptide maturation system protein